MKIRDAEIGMKVLFGTRSHDPVLPAVIVDIGVPEFTRRRMIQVIIPDGRKRWTDASNVDPMGSVRIQEIP